MKRLASIGSWPWWTVALVGVAWLSLYGFWMWRQVESTAVSLAEICSSLRIGCNLTVEPVWYQYVFWAGLPVVLLGTRWLTGRRVARAA